MTVQKSPKANEWVEGSSMSSPDPLTLSSHTFPKLTTPIRARSKTPISQRSGGSIKRQLNFDNESDLRSSPSKSITMDTPGNASPWRIKVTVEAERREDENGEIIDFDVKPTPKRKSTNGVTKTIVPLKDADDSPPSRGRRKPRRSSGGAKKRKPTPARRKSTRKAETLPGPLLSDIGVGSSPSQEQQRAKPRSKSRQPQDEKAANEIPPFESNAHIDRAPVFNFATLTPLHEKHILPPPVDESRFVQARQKSKQGRSGIVPKGWSAPIFSPLPPRSSFVLQADKLDDSSLLNGSLAGGEDSEQHVQVSLVEVVASTGLDRVDNLEADRPTNTHPNDKHGEYSFPEIQAHGASVHEPGDHRAENYDSRDHDNRDHGIGISGGEDDEERRHLIQDQAGAKASDEEEEEEEEEADAIMWRSMIKHSDDPEEDEAATEGAAATDFDDDEFGLVDEMTGVIGDKTMMQSEEFSMVSIGSLPSARELHSSFVENGGRKDSHIPALAPEQAHISAQQSSFQPTKRDRPVHPQSQSPLSKHSTPGASALHHKSVGSTSSQKPKKATPKTEVEMDQDASIASQPETPADASPKIQDMSSIMRSWQRNLAPIEHSFIAGAQNRRVPATLLSPAPVPVQQSFKDTTLTPKREDLVSNPSSGIRYSTQDAAKLPTPSSSEDEFGATDLPPELPNDDDDDVGSEHSLRTRLQRAADEQLRSENNASYAAGLDTAMEDVEQAEYEQRSSPNNTLSREIKWQREREEVIRQAQVANSSRVITINSDSEDDSEESDEGPEPQNPRSDDVDIWQEEASRSANLDDTKPAEQGIERSFTRLSSDSNPRPTKIARFPRSKSAIDAAHEAQAQVDIISGPDESQISAVESEHPSQDESAAAIRNMFKSITGTTYSPVKPREAPEDEDKEDQDEGPERIYDTSNVANGPGKVENKAEHSTSSSSSSDSAARDTYYKIKSPDAHGTVFDESGGFPSSPIKPKNSTTMLSDVRQVHREMRYANNLQTHTEKVGEPTSITSRKRKHAEVLEEQPPLPTIPQHDPASQPSIFSSLWHGLWTKPKRPSHSLLVHLPLLPKIEPWTRTHYLVLQSLWHHLIDYPDRFSFYHPANKELYTTKWRYFEDMEFTNHGLTVRMDRSLILLSAIFSELLILNGEADFERVEGIKIDPPRWGPSAWAFKNGRETPITEFSVVIHVFTLIGGAWMREEEAKGKVFGKGCMYWRQKGVEEWSAGGTAYWKIVRVVDFIKKGYGPPGFKN